MTCANIGLTLLALLAFSFTVWPAWGGETAMQWVVGIAMLLIIVIAWTGVHCKCQPCPTKRKK